MAGHSIKQVPGGLPEKVAFEKDFKEFPGGSDGKKKKKKIFLQCRRLEFYPWKNPLEKGTATHSRILAWRIPWTEEPDRLQSMSSQRVGCG